jgi:hypothetical protein
MTFCIYQFVRGDAQDRANSGASTTVSSAGRLSPASAVASVEGTSRKRLQVAHHILLPVMHGHLPLVSRS